MGFKNCKIAVYLFSLWHLKRLFWYGAVTLHLSLRLGFDSGQTLVSDGHSLCYCCLGCALLFCVGCTEQMDLGRLDGQMSGSRVFVGEGWPQHVDPWDIRFRGKEEYIGPTRMYTGKSFCVQGYHVIFPCFSGGFIM